MRKFNLILIVCLFSLKTKGHPDSLQQKKFREISIGTPLLPTLTYDSRVYNLFIGQNLEKYSTIYFFSPFGILYKTSTTNLNKKRRIGLIVSKNPNKFQTEKLPTGETGKWTDYGTLFLASYFGTERKLNKGDRFNISFSYDIGIGLSESYYLQYGSSVPEKYLMSRKFVYYLDLGLSMSYYISKKIFIESEILFMPYFYTGKVTSGGAFPLSYNGRVSQMVGYGIIPSKFFGINLGYKFQQK